ncbi:MAG: methylmalonyl Co-A mutase-associated GTPase MeaB [Candidatus Lokiarchaeota archaeon]|nr:methylmalonyl Co-A mutase-associated GTPase MeaB [Candidatus Lokiarchaeota archaeon]MBD3201394.1 methylmalonyl Co-A mutase-associated GTPase MeaB [Candidatus Lokiarchaeota archaeon]
MNKKYSIENLCNRFKENDKVALSKLITLVENDPDSALEIFNKLNHVENESYIIGITGSPGVGKSTLTGQIVKRFTDQDKKVGVISVDPTSPFSGGAFLGDRVRMTDISCHPNVFMRSLASRGYKGGISRAVFDISLLYEAFGMDVIIIETVGVGQAEFEIYKLVYTTVVILVPGYGDAIQMQKAGIIEIGDIYDVNKKDLGGEDIVVQIEMMLDDATTSQSGWRPPALMTNSINGEGIDDLIEKIYDHKEYLEQSEILKEKKKQRYTFKLKEAMVDKIERILFEQLFDKDELETAASELLNKKFEIYHKLNKMFDNVKFDVEKK